MDGMSHRTLAFLGATFTLFAPSLALADPSCKHMFENGVCFGFTLVAIAFLASPVGAVGLFSMVVLLLLKKIQPSRLFALWAFGNFPLPVVSLIVISELPKALGLLGPGDDNFGVAFALTILLQIAYVVLAARSMRVVTPAKAQ